jgi:hypothetical protein
MANPKELRQRAERLFALALGARERGDNPLAEQLTERAIQYLEGGRQRGFARAVASAAPAAAGSPAAAKPGAATHGWQRERR